MHHDHLHNLIHVTFSIVSFFVKELEILNETVKETADLVVNKNKALFKPLTHTNEN